MRRIEWMEYSAKGTIFGSQFAWTCKRCGWESQKTETTLKADQSPVLENFARKSDRIVQGSVKRKAVEVWRKYSEFGQRIL